jgi:hypothetical protein
MTDTTAARDASELARSVCTRGPQCSRWPEHRTAEEAAPNAALNPEPGRK